MTAGLTASRLVNYVLVMAALFDGGDIRHSCVIRYKILVIIIMMMNCYVEAILRSFTIVAGYVCDCGSF